MTSRGPGQTRTTSPAAIAVAHVEAFNAGDWERFTAPLSPDVIYLEMGTGRRIVGVDEHLRMAQEWKRAFPDSRARITDQISGGNVAVLSLVWTGTHSGELATPTGSLPPTGASVEVQASMWFVLEEDEIVENRHYLDMLALLRQIGALAS